MSLPRYAKYKDSSIPWFGLIPTGWEIKRLKDVIAKSESGTSVNSIDNTAVEGERGVLKTSCVYSGTFDYTENKAVVLDEYEFVSCPLAEGTLIVSRMNTPDLVGMAGLVKFAPVGIFLPDRLWQITFASASPSFVHYWTQVDAYRVQVRMACAGASSSMQNLSQGQFGAFRVPYPPIKEQVAIATFLDRETAKIDALVSEQEKLITLLAEKRQATISRAVTKGLNPNAPMKDSGVEWLGEVPKHWTVKAIKLLSSVQRGASPRPIDDEKYFDDNGEFSWVRIADVSASDGILRSSEQRLSELGANLSVKLQPGQLFISIAGTVGKPCITGIKACIHDGFVYFPRLELPHKFLFRIFEAGRCYAGLGKFGTQLNLNTDTVGSIRVGVPPLSEILAILEFLDGELDELDALVFEANRGITLLQERRSALISAAVTGKIDVRQASQQEQTMQEAA